MRYLKNFESYRIQNKSLNNVNEEFIGNLFKKIKSNLSLRFSKMFGSASKVDELIFDYEKELKKSLLPLIELFSKLALLEKEKKSSETSDSRKAEIEKERSRLFKEIKNADNIYEKNKEIMKQKNNLKIEDAISEEDNVRVKNYVNIKKLELQQRLIQYKMNEISKKSKLDITSLKDIMSEIFNEDEKKLKEIDEMKKKEANILKSGIKSKEDDKEIKKGDMVEYKSEKDETKTFRNLVNSVSDDEVEIKTKNSGIIKRKLSEVTLVKK